MNKGEIDLNDSYPVKERLWDVIGENTHLKQENFYLRTKIKQIERIIDETKKYLNDEL